MKMLDDLPVCVVAVFRRHMGEYGPKGCDPDDNTRGEPFDDESIYDSEYRRAVAECVEELREEMISTEEAKAGLRMLAFTGLHDLSILEMQAFTRLMCKLEARAAE